MGRRNTCRRGLLPRPEVRADDPTLTCFGGLLPAILFMSETLGLPQQLRQVVGAAGRRIHPVHHVLFAFVVGALAGLNRLAHLEWFRNDAVMLRYLRLAYWPVRRVFSAALRLPDAAVVSLERLVAAVGAGSLSRPSSVVLDFDNTAIVSYGNHAEGALFGYCGKGRRRRRHYPLVASIAETRAVLAAMYRDGSNMKTPELLDFVSRTVRRVWTLFGRGCLVVVRGDSSFWNVQLARTLCAGGVPFVFAYALNPGLKLMLMTTEFEVHDADEGIEYAVLDGATLGHDSGLRVVVIRRRVDDAGAPPQGKKIEWSSGWRYQAIVTNTDWDAIDVWRFYNDRGDCERVFRVGKMALGLANLVGQDFRANEVAFLLRLLAYNADLRFQQDAEQRARRGERKVHKLGLLWRQLRFYNSPARLLREQSRPVLRTVPGHAMAELWSFFAPDDMAVSAREVLA